MTTVEPCATSLVITAKVDVGAFVAEVVEESVVGLAVEDSSLEELDDPPL